MKRSCSLLLLLLVLSMVLTGCSVPGGGNNNGTTVSRFGIPGEDAHVPLVLSSSVWGAWSVPMIDVSSKSSIVTLSSFGLRGGFVFMNVPYILYAELSRSKWCGVNSQLTGILLLALFTILSDLLELK